MVNTQMIPYLKSIGFSLEERGILFAGSALVAILGQFAAGYLCDRRQKIKPFFLLFYVLLTVSAAMLFCLRKEWFFYHLLSVGLCGGLVRVIMGLDETWMLKLGKQRYGKLRCAGAIGLCVGSPLAGWLVTAFGYLSLLWTFVGASALLLLLVWRVKEEKQQKEAMCLQDIKELLKNKRYLLLVLIFFLIYMIGTADQYAVVDKMLHLKAGNEAIGIKWAVQSFMEIPLFLFAANLLQRFAPVCLLKAGIFFYAVKFLLYGVVQHPWLVIAVSTLQLVTLPMIMLSSKLLIQEITSEKLFNSAQMFAMAVFVGGSMLLTPPLTAFLCDRCGYDTTLYMIAVFAILPLALSMLYTKGGKQKQAADRKAMGEGEEG